MKILLILANQPYNGSDNTYNALRLAENLHKKGEEVRIFLMNDAVDLVRDSTEKPRDYDIDLVAKLKEAISWRRGAKSMRQLSKQMRRARRRALL